MSDKKPELSAAMKSKLEPKVFKKNPIMWKQKLPVYLQMDEQVPYGTLMKLMQNWMNRDKL